MAITIHVRLEKCESSGHFFSVFWDCFDGSLVTESSPDEALKAIIEAIAVYATNESGGNGIVLAAKKLGFPDSVATRFGKVASKIVLLPPRGNYSDFAEQAARAIEPTLDLVIEFVEGVVGRAGSELGNLVPDDES